VNTDQGGKNSERKVFLTVLEKKRLKEAGEFNIGEGVT